MTLPISQRKRLINVSFFKETTGYQERTCNILNKCFLNIERAMFLIKSCLPCEGTLFIEMEAKIA
jgi:hypothetical protein